MKKKPSFGLLVYLVFICLVVIMKGGGFAFLDASSCCAAQLPADRYIGIDEIKTGMKGYCLTCLKGTGVEKFDLEVVSVVKNMNPGRDAILVESSDERFIHAGVIGGVSGSPVFIDGKMAGAMSFGWNDSKDPLYGVTPIADMLEVGANLGSQKGGSTQYTCDIDFSKPLNLLLFNGRFENPNQDPNPLRPRREASPPSGVMPALTCPVITSALPASAAEKLRRFFEPLGMTIIPSATGSSSVINNPSLTQSSNGETAKIVPGATLIVPMVTGDVIVSVTGTVTEVVDDKVYGFGHSFLGYGPVDLPLATGEVHTVVVGNSRSFKLASPLEIVGALRADQDAAVFGLLGEQAYMFPVNVSVERYNSPVKKTFNCMSVHNRMYTPAMVATVINAAAAYQGDFPPDNMVSYKVTIKTKQAEPIVFENISTGLADTDAYIETMNAIRLLMTNPFKKVEIQSVEVEMKIEAKDITSHIWSTQVSDTDVEPGEQIRVDVVTEPVLSSKKRYSFDLTVPANLEKGSYELIVCGGNQYLSVLNQLAPHRFVAQNFDTLIEAMQDVLNHKRNNLYCLLVLPASGIVLEKSELVDLPASKTVILSDPKRSIVAAPMRKWIEKKIQTDTIAGDATKIKINVTPQGQE